MATDCESWATAWLVADSILLMIAWVLTGYYVLYIHPWYKNNYRWKAMVDSVRGAISALVIQNNYGFFTNDNALVWYYPLDMHETKFFQTWWGYWKKLGKTRDELTSVLREAGYPHIANEQNPVKQHNMLRFRPGESYPYYIVADRRIHLFEKHEEK